MHPDFKDFSDIFIGGLVHISKAVINNHQVQCEDPVMYKIISSAFKISSNECFLTHTHTCTYMCASTHTTYIPQTPLLCIALFFFLLQKISWKNSK